MPGETISAFTPSQDLALVRSASAIPSASAVARAAALSSQATTSAPPARERRDRRQPRAPEPEHRHPVAGIAADRDHARRAGMPESFAYAYGFVHGLCMRHDRRQRSAHRSFSVASPIIARISETIQKRMTICGSAQPSFSK